MGFCATVNEVVWEDLAEEKALKQRAEEGEAPCHTCARAQVPVQRMCYFS